MEIEIKHECTEYEWEIVSNTLREVGMAHYEPAIHKKAFDNSYICVFAYREDQLVGFGRAISDGVYQAAIYDVAVTPALQKKGIGSKIIESIVSGLPNCNFILYTIPGREDFYRKHGFRKMFTGMAKFIKADDLKQRGFTE